MQRWRLTPDDLPLAPRVVAGVLAGVGTPRLAAHYLAAVQGLLPVTFCTVFAVGASGRIETVSAASSYGDTAERTAGRYVAQRYDRVDPMMVWLAARKRPARAQLWLGHHRGEELADAGYRAACYTDVGIRERASVLVLSPGGQRAAISFYRSLAQPEFAAADFALLQAHACLLADATAAHGRVAAPGASGAAVVAGELLRLSPREREVLDRLAAGRTASQAAQDLGVALSTVRTLQYRAFRRLGLRSVKDLLCGAGHAG
ncbi:LuxR C-terminal-related transcriptional regulator [Pseudorhodoferax sp. Leaf274]|uniref:helix-turn-helix transcriptional regulator n=1 Tax=Pseudorhodoferax sp. Leaf274 TaxID=1736318 RepID=UPI0007037105|nr:LuxR C-terminal-related transcriptional regulator [Pseudorhodoferax sp. Leaf274]KQP49956.1 LuxR family transcriptional regulator [Pseudorhodoferax sp. Leaf274]